MTTETQTPAGRNRLLAGIAIAVIGGGLIWWVSQPPSQPDLLNSWLSSHKYTPLSPIRSTVALGSVVQIDRNGQLIAIDADSFDYSAVKTDETSMPDVTLKLLTSASGAISASLPGIDTVALDAAGVSHVELVLSDVTVRRMSLENVGAAVRKHESLMRADQRKMHGRLFLVAVETVEAQLSVTFRAANEAKVDLKGKAKDIAAQLNASAEATSSGVIVSKAPVVLGFKGYEPRDVALDLGPEKSRFELTPRSPEFLEKWLLAQKQRPEKAGSNFNIAVLSMGLGNYRTQLDGSESSAQTVGSVFETVTSRDNISLFTSKNIPRTDKFDTDARRTRKEILDGVKAFVDEQKHLLPEDEQRLTVFYYFGHGVTDKALEMPYIRPEAFVKKDGESMLKAGERLVSVSEIISILEELNAPILLLLDMCRSQEADDDGSWIPDFEKPTDNQIDQLAKDVISGLRLSSGREGPHVMLFAAPHGEAADPVDADWSDEKVGPLAVLLIDTFDSGAATERPWQLMDIVREFQKGRTVAGAGDIQAYTDIRDNFLQQLPPAAVWGPRSLTPLPGKIDVPNAGNFPVASSPDRVFGIVVDDVFKAKIFGVPKDFCRAGGWVFSLHDDGIRAWDRDSSEPGKALDKITTPVLGSSGDGIVYVADDIEHKLFELTKTLELKTLHEGVYATRLIPGIDGKSLVILEDDSTQGTADPLWRMTGKEMKKVDEFDLTSVSSLVEIAPDEFVFATDSSESLLCRKSGVQREYAPAAKLPGGMTLGKTYLFVLNQDWTVIYRIHLQTESVEACSLEGTNLPQRIPDVTDTTRGFHWVNSKKLWLATLDGIVFIDVSNARWSKVEN